MFGTLLKDIEEAEIITIFRHENPDCDAFGSQYSLKNWIADNWPSKQVHACGTQSCGNGIWPALESVSDDTIRNSLVIVLDTANQERVDDQRYSTGKKIIKIDHHPERDPFGNEQYVYPQMAATCEILSEFFHQCSDQNVSKQTASFLYKGLLTDTLRFTSSNTSQHTMEMAAFLTGFGLDIPSLNRELFDEELWEFRYRNMLAENMQMMGDHFVYCIVPEKTMQEWNVSASRTRSFVTVFGNVRPFQVWAIFTEKTENGITRYDGSLRSKTVRINDLAEQYGGGGHPNASGVKNLDEKMLKTLLESLFQKAEQAF